MFTGTDKSHNYWLEEVSIKIAFQNFIWYNFIFDTVDETFGTFLTEVVGYSLRVDELVCVLNFI